MNTTTEQTFEQQQAFSPLLMQANHILSLSQADLEMAIGEAIDENPALELEDTAVCPICGRPTSGEPCVVCRASLADAPPPRAEDTSLGYEPEYRVSGAADPDFDPMTLIASADDVREELLEAAMASLDSEREQAVAMLLVDAIDERGFLCVDLREIASMANEPLEAVERILGAIQEIAPPGVGARSLQECLLLQVAYLRDEGTAIPEGIEAIIADHLEELGAKRISRIARALELEPAQVEEARGFIRDQLTPHPLQSHESPTWTAPSTGGHVVPDVVVTIDGDRLRIEVPNAVYDRLRTNSLYHAIARPGSAPERSEAESEPNPPVADVDQAAVDHAKSQVTKAQQFIWAVRQRRQTLLRVAEYVCDYQEAFVRGDARGLRPLTRSEVAMALGVHESTCSRAVAGKFVMLPSRRVIPMSDLFAASLSIKHVIQQIIQDECAAGRALSDAQISDRLLDHGIRIARRTVAKYRSQMHILPSTIR